MKFRQTLLLISEFLGSANVAGVGNVNMGADADTDGSNMSLTGRVEVQRRRITADGHIKLKMSMFGVPVSRCGIYISQFKGDQQSLSCRHIFHKSLRQWLVRSRRARCVVSVWILEIVDTMCVSCITMFTFQIFCCFRSFVVSGSLYYCG